MGLEIHATYDIFNLYIIISMFYLCATKYFIMTEKMDFYGIRDIMNETLNEKKAFVPRHGDKESLDNITAQLNEAKMHPCVFLNNHAIGIEAAGDFMKLLNSGEEQYADNDMVDKDLLKNVYNTLKKIYKDEGKKLKESTMFNSVLKESGIEVYPEDGKLKARNIGQQVVSSRTQNKLNPLGTKDVAKPLTPTQKAATSAVLSILNDKGKAGDINSEFDTNPRPDITLMANGDAVITPDGQKSRSYKIPASEIDAHMKEARVFSHSSGFGLSGHYGYEEPKEDPLYIATETNEDDCELYFDEKGNTTEFKTDAKKFTSEKDALEFAKSNVIFGEPGTKLLENCKLNEKRIEIPNPYPVKKEEIIDLVERSTRLTHTATDSKTIQLYIYSNGNDRPEAFAEVEITSAGYILHGAEGYDYQGTSMKEFDDDLRDVVFHYDAITSKRFGENAISKETLFGNLLNEDYRNWFNFTIKTEKGRYLKATYPTVTELKRCVTPIFGKFEIINQKKLPLTVTQEILDECPETAYVKAGNSTWAENFYSRVVSKGYAYPIIRKNWDAYLVKDKEGFDSCQKDLVINGIDYFPTDTKVGEKIRWRMDINNAEVSENNLFGSILNESSLKEYFFYAPPRPEEDEDKDTIIGYIAAVRDYQTQKTKYVDDDGNVCNSKSQAKVFDTKGKADNYSYEHCPEGWTHFVVALKKSGILNEGRISSDDKIKIIERFKAYCIKYEVDAQPVGECSDGIYVYCNNPNDVERIIRDWREKGFGAVSDGQKVNIYKKLSTILESNIVIASWRRDTAERLIKEANKIDPSYSFVEYDIGPKKEIKYKVYKNDDEYVGTFDVFTDEPYNSPYRFFFNHVNIPNVEFQGMDIDEFDKMFKDFIITDKRLGHKH